MINTKNIFFCMLLLCFSHASAQEGIGLLVKYADEGVKLKMIPEDANFWMIGLENGYIISRRDIGKTSSFVDLNIVPILPSKESEWPDTPRGKEMYKFHLKAIQEVKKHGKGESLLETFRNKNEADQNYAMYAFITMRDEEFGDYVGMEFLDEKALPNQLYEYQVRIAGTNYKSKSVLVDTHHKLTSPSLQMTSRDLAVEASWSHKNRGKIIGYFLEKSSTGLEYLRMHDSPIIAQSQRMTYTIATEIWQHMIEIDSLSSNYQPNYYRLVGLDVWGDELPPSSPVIAMGIDLTPPVVEGLRAVVDTTANSFILNWERSEDGDVANYFVTQSFELNGKDSIIVSEIDPKGKLEYTIQSPLDMKDYYFRVGAIDTAGNMALSGYKTVFMLDLTPPTKVEGILTDVDSLGKVILEWPSSQDNHLKGYSVFRSFSKNRDYIKITDTVYTSTLFVDTCSLSLLNNKRYYKIQAVDKSFNLSEISDVVIVNLRDTIPPSITTIKSVSKVDAGVKITWLPNQSEDVKSYSVYKNLGNQDILVQKTNASITEIIDLKTDANSDSTYYFIVAEDESGNVAKAYYPMHVTASTKEPLLNLKAQKLNKETKLEWDAVGDRYKIYRAEDDRFKILEYTKKAQLTDVNASISSSYYVKAFDAKGRLIATSEIVKR